MSNADQNPLASGLSSEPRLLKEAEYFNLLDRIKHDLFSPPTVQVIDVHGEYCDPSIEYLTPPAYETEGSAAVDLRWDGRAYGPGYSKQGSYVIDGSEPDKGLLLMPGERIRLGTGLKIHCESEAVTALALPRSGFGSKGLVISNLVGLIDPDYQGEWFVTLWNASQVPQTIKPGDRLIQAMFLGRGGIIRPKFEFVEEFGEETTRGEGGFGSTGR